MQKVHLAIVWHQHQPYYLDPVAGRFAMPWVRLHGLRDYYGMARLMDEHPDCHLTINLVPSLIAQIERYLDGSATDRPQELAAIDAADLSEAEREEIVAFFFHANREQMIGPFPRYRELLAKRHDGSESVAEAAKRFTTGEMRDLQLLFHLAWTHPLARRDFPVIGELVAKGSGFSEADKAAFVGAQQELLAAIVPMHKRLADSGTLELTTSPFYHPILPLLCRTASAHEAMPGAPLPQGKPDLPEDAERQVADAMAFFADRFGARPAGLWPSEGSVSEEILPILARQGVRWIASDEEVLYRSEGLDGVPLERTAAYETSAGVSIVFRDHQLSDKIGFQYQGMGAEAAADDFIRSALASAATASHPEPLVCVILDGENAWDTYPNAGVDFLGKLYQKLATDKRIQPTTVSEYLAAHPPERKLRRLFAGSWIDHNFAIWIGHEEDRQAWDAVGQVRRFLAEQEDAGPQTVAAWEELYAAEGSDWFWWYGDDRFSGMDDEFDRLFRQHLKNVYLLLAAEPPAFLDDPIAASGRGAVYSTPAAFMTKTELDGQVSHYFEWLPAGHYARAREAGSMAQAGPGLVSDLYFGFDRQTLYLRIDPQNRADLIGRADASIRIVFAAPREVRLLLERLDAEPTVTWLEADREPVANGCRLAIDTVIELAVPFERLGAEPGDAIRFFVEVYHGETLAEKLPSRSPVVLECPSEEFDRMLWSV